MKRKKLKIKSNTLFVYKSQKAYLAQLIGDTTTATTTVTGTGIAI